MRIASTSLASFTVCPSPGGTNWKTFAEVKAQNIGQDKADYFTTKGTVVFLRKENCMYQVGS